MGQDSVKCKDLQLKEFATLSIKTSLLVRCTKGKKWAVFYAVDASGLGLFFFPHTYTLFLCLKACFTVPSTLFTPCVSVCKVLEAKKDILRVAREEINICLWGRNWLLNADNRPLTFLESPIRKNLLPPEDWRYASLFYWFLETRGFWDRPQTWYHENGKNQSETASISLHATENFLQNAKNTCYHETFVAYNLKTMTIVPIF